MAHAETSPNHQGMLQFFPVDSNRFDQAFQRIEAEPWAERKPDFEKVPEHAQAGVHENVAHFGNDLFRRCSEIVTGLRRFRQQFDEPGGPSKLSKRNASPATGPVKTW